MAKKAKRQTKIPPKRQTKATKGTLKPLEENDPVFRRGPVNYSGGRPSRSRGAAKSSNLTVSPHAGPLTSNATIAGMRMRVICKATFA